MWAGTGKSEELLATAWCGDGQSLELARELAKGELGGFYYLVKLRVRFANEA